MDSQLHYSSLVYYPKEIQSFQSFCCFYIILNKCKYTYYQNYNHLDIVWVRVLGQLSFLQPGVVRVQLSELGTFRLGFLLVLVLHQSEHRVEDKSCILGHKVCVDTRVGLHTLLHVSEVGVQD